MFLLLCAARLDTSAFEYVKYVNTATVIMYMDLTWD